MLKNNLLSLVFLLSFLTSCNLDSKKEIKEDFLANWNQASIDKLKTYNETCNKDDMVLLSFSRAFKQRIRYKILKKYKYKPNQIIEFFETYENEQNNYCAIFIDNKVINYKIDLSKDFELSVIPINNDYAINLDNIDIYRNACSKGLKVVCDDSFNKSGKISLYSKIKIEDTSLRVTKHCMEVGLKGQVGDGLN